MEECCHEKFPCSKGQGDCDTDSECEGNLVCGTDNCDQTQFLWSGADCCKDWGTYTP